MKYGPKCRTQLFDSALIRTVKRASFTDGYYLFYKKKAKRKGEGSFGWEQKGTRWKIKDGRSGQQKLDQSCNDARPDRQPRHNIHMDKDQDMCIVWEILQQHKKKNLFYVLRSIRRSYTLVSISLMFLFELEKDWYWWFILKAL